MKFNCTDCQSEFEGNDFTTECEICNSTKIKASESGTKVPWKKVSLGVGILVLVIFLIKNCSGREIDSTGPGGGPHTYTVEIKQVDTKWKVEANRAETNGSTTNALPFIKKIINKSNQEEISFNSKTGELYLCSSDTLFTTNLEIVWREKGRKTNVSKKLSIVGPLSQNANCPIIPGPADFTFSTNPNTCEISLSVVDPSRRNQIEKGDLSISINGMNGMFKKRTSWNPIDEGLSVWDVFVICNNKRDTIEFKKINGQSYTCALPMSVPERRRLEGELQKEFDILLKSCDDRKTLKRLSVMLKSIKVIGEINGNKCDWADVYSTIIAGCPSSTYEMVEPIQISSSGNSASIKIRQK